MKALILVDIQNDFCEGGALAVSGANQIIEDVNSLQEEMKDLIIVATQDFHPQNHKSFASNNEGAKIGDMRELAGKPQVMWPDHCVKGTKGSEFHEKLNLNNIDKIFPKGENPEIDSYSGFFDNDGVSSTGLSEYLKEKGVTEVIVVGLALDYCVKFTALDAVKEGFKTTVVLELTRSVNLNKDDDKKSIKELIEAGVNCNNKDLKSLDTIQYNKNKEFYDLLKKGKNESKGFKDKLKEVEELLLELGIKDVELKDFCCKKQDYFFGKSIVEIIVLNQADDYVSLLKDKLGK